jgi:hypothetical protein
VIITHLTKVIFFVAILISGFVGFYNQLRNRKALGLSPKDYFLLYQAGGTDQLLAQSKKRKAWALILCVLGCGVVALWWIRDRHADFIFVLGVIGLIFFSPAIFLFMSGLTKRSIAERIKKAADAGSIQQ